VIVLTGAGMSASLAISDFCSGALACIRGWGISDFRSKGTGLATGLSSKLERLGLGRPHEA